MTLHRRWVQERRVALWWGVALLLPLSFLALFFVWPLITLLFTGLFGDERFGGANESVLSELAQPRTWDVVGQTLIQATLGTLCSLLLGVPGAFVLYRLEFRGRALLRALVTVPFVLPTVVVAVAFTALFGPGGLLAGLGWDRSLVVIVLALTFFNVTVVIRTVGGFWAQLDPRAVQAARTLGAGAVRAWCTVTLPALAPALASAAALVFLFCSTSFGVVLVLGGREFSTIETEIYRLSMQYLDLRGAAVLALLQLVMVVLVLWVSNRLARRREQRVQMRYAAQRVRPSRVHVPVIVAFVTTLLLLHVVPLGALIVQSLRTPDGALTFAHYINLLVVPDSVQLSSTAWDALWVSLRSALWATALAVVLGVLIALVVSRRPRSRLLQRGSAVVDGLVMLPLGVSSVVLGLGLLLTMHNPLGFLVDLRTSAVLIPIAQALVALPLVVRMLVPVLRGIDPLLRDAAATLGASPMRVLGSIDLRMLGRAAGLALGCAFATSLGEFGASSFLVRPGETTLPVLIAEMIGKPGAVYYGMALAAAVVLGAVTAGIMVWAERLRGEGVSEW